jgi:sugar phosphate isomerase/epimerase
MKLIFFTKLFKEKSLLELAAFAHSAGLDGFDLCVRPGYVVNADNAAKELPAAAAFSKREGLSIPMVTANFDLLYPDQPGAESLLAAMNDANIRFLKLGYFGFDPLKQNYWQEVDRIRKAFDGWQKLSRKHGVRICYHTHSHRCMGLNCAALAHLIRGYDPACIGAYIDPCHMTIEGEEFAVGLAMIREHLSLIALKDVTLVRKEKNGHGSEKYEMKLAGEGMVDWTAVFDELKRVGYDGPLTVHCEFEVPKDQFDAAARHDAKFFRAQIERVKGVGDRK